MRTFDVSAAKVIDLETRLAQAERELQAARTGAEFREGTIQALIAERDAALAGLSKYKEQFAEREMREERITDDWEKTCIELKQEVFALKTQLSAALAKAEEWGKEARRMDAEIGFGHERENALRAKAEAAERRAEAAEEYADFAQQEHANLRARIEALAEQWTRDGHHHKHVYIDMLRALLQPTKPESALDVLSRIEDIVARSGMGENSYTEPLAKLRKLLEEQK